MDVSEDALLAMFADASMLRESDEKAEPWRRGIQDGGLILQGGRNGAVEAVLNYLTDADASRAEEFVEAALDEACADSRVQCVIARLMIRDVEISRESSRLRVRFVLSAELLEAVLAR
jgi:hypothetical protein